MTDLLRYAAELEDRTDRPLPPVASWNPPFRGEIDLVIRRDGVWVHEGTPIARARLVRLFSTVLRREGDRYFLVTPAEKLGVRVEDAPFLAVIARREGEGADQTFVFTTNVGDRVAAGPDHPIAFRCREGEWAPYIEVRDGLEALIARAPYYDLVAAGETREIDGEAWFGVSSGGAFFPFRPAREISVGET